LEDLDKAEPQLRLGTFDLPPLSCILVEADQIVARLYKEVSRVDPELYAVHTSSFLGAPHILIPLFNHIMSLRSEDNAAFPIQLKKLAEQMRGLLLEHGRSVRIEKITRSHLELWADVEGWQIAFLDGGVARLPSMAGLEPMALRVGVYAVVPGEKNPQLREHWSMSPFVIPDIIDFDNRPPEPTDRRRLMEAARYVLEPLVGLSELRKHPRTKVLLLHGPLVNQFLTYDEGEPHYIPSLSADFLKNWGIERAEVEATVKDLPRSSDSGEPLWNQFMAIYGYVMATVNKCETPIAGVVERIASRSAAFAVLEALFEDRVIDEPYIKRAREILERYEINDDFLFGCILRDGEYVTPVRILKNLPRRARERWQPVVKQYPAPFATMLKADESRFPFRIEMNESGKRSTEVLLRLVYHTARLLPRYAFPVGLDIADKYARIPDWLSKGVSAEIAAVVLRRALRTGDARIVTQVKGLLTGTPRDFFFRPGIEV